MRKYSPNHLYALDNTYLTPVQKKEMINTLECCVPTIDRKIRFSVHIESNSVIAKYIDEKDRLDWLTEKHRDIAYTAVFTYLKTKNLH